MYVRGVLAGCIAVMLHWGCGSDTVDDSPSNASSEPDVSVEEPDDWLDGVDPDVWLDYLAMLHCLESPDDHERLENSLGSGDQRHIVIGQTEMSSIDPADGLIGDNNTEQWFFLVCKGREFTIDVVSAEIDPIVVLLRDHGVDNSDFITSDNDSGDGFNARIVMDLELGVYRVGVWSDETVRQPFGSYMISVR